MERKKLFYRPKKSKLQKFARLLLIFVSGLIATYGMAYISVSFMVYQKEQELKQQWGKVICYPNALPAYYPKEEKNRTAIQLEEMVKVDNNRFDLKGPGRYWRWENSKEWYLDSELNKNTDEIYLPEKAKIYLQEHKEDYEALYKELRNGSPEWGFCNIKKIEDPLTYGKLISRPSYMNLTVIRSLINLIALDVLNKTMEGRNQEALEAFKYGWYIRESVCRRPDLFSQLVTVVSDYTLMKLLWKMRNVPSEWQERIVEYNYNRYALLSFTADSWLYLDKMDRMENLFEFYRGTLNNIWYEEDMYAIQISKLQERVEILLTTLTRPYFQLCSLNHIEANYREIIQYVNKDICSIKENNEFKYEDSIPWWDLISRFCKYRFTPTWKSLISSQFRVEATKAMLKVREIRAANPNEPEQEIFVINSSICKDGQWIYKGYRDGFISLSYNRNVYCLSEDYKKRAFLSMEWQTK